MRSFCKSRLRAIALFLGPSSKSPETRKWPRCLNALARVYLKKKRGCSQSVIRVLCSQFFSYQILLNGPERGAASMRFSMYTMLPVSWLMWCLRYFQFECLLHLQSQAAQPLHLKLDEFEFSRYFIEINKENESLNLPIDCSSGGPIGQNVLPLNYLKVGFKWLSTQCCAFVICLCSIIPWALSICKEISVKNSDKWYWTWKRLRKEKCVRVVPFAKYQKTCEKEMC